MGNTLSWLFPSFFEDQEGQVLILGLDNAGKTSMLYYLKEGEFINTVPTIGFNAETLDIGGVKAHVWDLGGQDSIRPYWRSYYHKQNAVVFVVDSTDRDRMSTARKELFGLLDEDELSSACLLVLANKQDVPNAMKIEEVVAVLGLTEICDRKWTVMPTSVKKGEGITEGFQWVSQRIQEGRATGSE